jgi:beta-hydroxylase
MKDETQERSERLRRQRRKRRKRSGKAWIQSLSSFIERHSRIGAGPRFSPSVFPWLAAFEENWHLIRAELDHVLAVADRLPAFHEVSPDQKRISHGDHWKIFPFYVFGDAFGPNLERCPQTARLLATVPNLRNAMFSILSPRYHIPPHRGPTNGVIRIHLGLIVPGGPDTCRIRVGSEVFGWEEGKCVVFDDYYEHEVWNDCDRSRVVLFFDVDRPLKAVASVVNKLVIGAIKQSPYVKDAKRNTWAWEAAYRSKTDPAS